MSLEKCGCNEFKKALEEEKIRRNFNFFGAWLITKTLETVFSCPFCHQVLKEEKH